MRKQGPSPGFTLAELLVVVLLLAVVASLGSLRLQRRNRALQVTRLAQELFLCATRARLLALSSRSQAQFLIDATDSDGDGLLATVHVATRPGFHPAPLHFGPALERVTVRQDARIRSVARGVHSGGALAASTASRTAIIFAPDGSARIGGSGATGATVYMTDDLGQNPHRIVIFGGTGMVKLLAH